MQKIQKNLYPLLFTVALLILCSFIAIKENIVLVRSLPEFNVKNSHEYNTVSVFDAEDGNYYVFLPSYSKMEETSVSVPPYHNFMIGNHFLTDRMSCAPFQLKTPYDFFIDGERVATLWFYKSENVATMYVNTATKNMERIHDDKEYSEYASVTLYTVDGSINYSDHYSMIKGRGNATWEYSKRPYTLTLSADGDLLNMGAAKKWVLLANALDQTNLNNKLIFDLAAQVGFSWSPDSQWVDLYLNGEYSGLYLLTEKVEVHENRLNLDLSSDSFLCKFDLEDRWDSMRNPFKTNIGRTVDLCYPYDPSVTESENIKYRINQMEQEIFYQKDLKNSSIIDLDSWVFRYLIDEISGNIDADLASSYFYYSKGKIYAGPIWDYDMALGNSIRNDVPTAFIAKNEKRITYDLSPYYSALYSNPTFYDRMVEMYETQFVPVLRQMIDRTIDEYSSHIDTATQMNTLRWKTMYDLQIPPAVIIHSAHELKDYFIQRVDFLNSAWLKNVSYCTIQFELGEIYRSISIPMGKCLDLTDLDLENTVWVNKETGSVVDFEEPIIKNLVLTQQSPEGFNAGEENDPSITVQEQESDTRVYVVLFSCGVLAVLLLGFCMIEIRRQQGVKKTDEQKQFPISS